MFGEPKDHFQNGLGLPGSVLNEFGRGPVAHN